MKELEGKVVDKAKPQRLADGRSSPLRLRR
jgi:hypothetical protein